MRLDSIKIGIASAVSIGIVWVFCSILVWGLPARMMDMSGHMIHVDLPDTGWYLTFTGFLVGLFAWSFVAGIIGTLIAYVYNKLV